MQIALLSYTMSSLLLLFLTNIIFTCFFNHICKYINSLPGTGDTFILTALCICCLFLAVLFLLKLFFHAAVAQKRPLWLQSVCPSIYLSTDTVSLIVNTLTQGR